MLHDDQLHFILLLRFNSAKQVENAFLTCKYLEAYNHHMQIKWKIHSKLAAIF